MIKLNHWKPEWKNKTNLITDMFALIFRGCLNKVDNGFKWSKWNTNDWSNRSKICKHNIISMSFEIKMYEWKIKYNRTHKQHKLKTDTINTLKFKKIEIINSLAVLCALMFRNWLNHVDYAFEKSAWKIIINGWFNWSKWCQQYDMCMRLDMKTYLFKITYQIKNWQFESNTDIIILLGSNLTHNKQLTCLFMLRCVIIVALLYIISLNNQHEK